MKTENHWPQLTAAALAAVVVGYASTIVVVMQAADAVGATPAQKISWAMLLCFAMGGLSLFLSVRHRLPVIIAWSTPGAALIAAGAQGTSYTAALGAFAFAGLLTVITGLVAPLARAIERMPPAVASAMLGGVLLTYVLKVPQAALAMPWQVLPLVVAFFALRLWKPLWTVPIIVVLGLGLAAASGKMAMSPGDFRLPVPTFDLPAFSPSAIISLGLPLYLVTMASQNLPGFAVIRASGYAPPVRSALVTTGLASALLSPMMGPQVNMAAITASLATGPDAHPDATQRWKVAFPYVVLYVLVGLGSGVFVSMLGGLPQDLIHAIAGLALFGPLLGAMVAMMKDDVEAALTTFLITASGLTLWHVGAAFWGLLAGLALWSVKTLKAKK